VWGGQYFHSQVLPIHLFTYYHTIRRYSLDTDS
jgi:hypothetical protein